MKNLLLLFLLLSCNATLACRCSPRKFAEKYTQSDFVAIVKIVKVYENEGSEMFYKSDIIISALYKGNSTSSIYAYGSSDGKTRSSCDIFFPEGTELIIYANKKSGTDYIFSSCSGYVNLTTKYNSKKREIDMLDSLKNLHINFTSKIWIDKKMGFSEELEQFKGIELNKTYGLYEITFSSGLLVKSVRKIIGFGDEIDNKLIQILQKSKWVSSQHDSSAHEVIKNHVPDNSKHLVGFYFYPPEKEDPSFVSEYDL